MGKFDRYHGILNVTVDGDVWELKPTMDDKRVLMKLAKESKNDDNAQAKISDKYFEIMKKSYPAEEDATLWNFLLQNEDKLAIELGKAFGWFTDKDLEDIKKKVVVQQEQTKN